MKKRMMTLVTALTLTVAAFAGCGSSSESKSEETATVSSDDAAEKTDSKENTEDVSDASTENGRVTLIGLADLTPHNELIEFVKPKLAEEGIDIDIVSTASDATWNEKVQDGEVDFNFMQHKPYMDEWNETNGGTLVDAGDIHVEPISAYSDYYSDVSEIPDDAKVVVPNDATNEYRALKILQDAGFIKLRDDLTELKASVDDIEEYIKPIEITEIDSIQIVGLAPDFDIYITNTNKAIEAGIDTSKYLFRESEDSPYANIIAVREEDKDNPAIKALVEALKSEETRAYIEEHYNGAVIPAKIN